MGACGESVHLRADKKPNKGHGGKSQGKTSPPRTCPQEPTSSKQDTHPRRSSYYEPVRGLTCWSSVETLTWAQSDVLHGSPGSSEFTLLESQDSLGN